jgi:DNA replication protein DnaC
VILFGSLNINPKTNEMNAETLEKMKSMKFWGMARAFTSCLEDGRMAKMTADEMLSFLITAEYDDRDNRRIDRSIRNARFRYNASIEKLYYGPERNLEKNQMMRYAECDFIAKSESILITGCTGIGKSYIASALGNQACLLGYKVYYTNITKLFSKLKMMKADGSYLREVSRIEKQDLLILDDFGLQPMDNHNRSALMELIEDRHGKRSTIITSQLPVQQWYDVIGEKTVADAILDRLVHDAHRIEIDGDSLRRKRKFINQ